MKKQFTILILFLFNCTFIYGQRFIKTDTPCDKELLKKTPGRWLPINQSFYTKPSKQEQQEMLNRLNAFHKLMFDLYPSPVAFDAQPSFTTSDALFGYQLKFERSAKGLNSSEVNGTPTLPYSYTGFFCAYGCGRATYEIGRGQGCESGTEMQIKTNSLKGFLYSQSLGEWADIMVIDGRPIQMMPVLIGKWKGYDQYSPQSGSGIRIVLIHREGMLPYIPVTRKQYLDRSIEYLQKFYDKLLSEGDKVAKVYADAGIKADPVEKEKLQKQKSDVIKYYRDELDATTKAGLLDSPAVIFGTMMAHILTQYPIFTTQDARGRLLVTENPAYMKKELPKYIPQLMYYTQWDCQCGADPSLNPYKLINEKFPIEKVQAMIDK